MATNQTRFVNAVKKAQRDNAYIKITAAQTEKGTVMKTSKLTLSGIDKFYAKGKNTDVDYYVGRHFAISTATARTLGVDVDAVRPRSGVADTIVRAGDAAGIAEAKRVTTGATTGASSRQGGIESLQSLVRLYDAIHPSRAGKGGKGRRSPTRSPDTPSAEVVLAAYRALSPAEKAAAGKKISAEMPASPVASPRSARSASPAGSQPSPSPAGRYAGKGKARKFK